MKKSIHVFLIFFLYLINHNINAQATIDCFTTPDGTDGPSAIGWEYKEYVVPTGYKLDSINGGFTRPSYPDYQLDFLFGITVGTTIYDDNVSTFPLDYSTIDTSMYNIWYDLTSFNYEAPSVIQVYIPSTQFAVWNNLCIAISPIITTSIEKSSLLLTDQILEAQLTDLNGRIVFKSKNEGVIDQLNIKNGIYLLIIRTDKQFITKKLLINN